MRIIIEDYKSKAFPISIRWSVNGHKYGNVFQTMEEMELWCFRFGKVKFIDKRRQS